MRLSAKKVLLFFILCVILFQKGVIFMSGLKVHKRKGIGRPSIKEGVKDKVVELYNAGNLTCKEIALVCGISVRSVFKILKEREEEERVE